MPFYHLIVDFETFQRVLNRPGGFRDPGEPEEYCRGFQVFDKDMTGFIGVGQLKYILTNLGEKMTDEEVDELLKAVDTSSGQVNYTGMLGPAFARSFPRDFPRSFSTLTIFVSRKQSSSGLSLPTKKTNRDREEVVQIMTGDTGFGGQTMLGMVWEESRDKFVQGEDGVIYHLLQGNCMCYNSGRRRSLDKI